MSATEGILAGLLVIACWATVWFAVWGTRWKRHADRQLLLMQHVAEAKVPDSTVDYVVSINDWGPDFEFSDLGRWRWVVWRGEPGEGAPTNLGNDINGQRAWLSVWSAIVRDWDSDHLTPSALIEWKKVTSHADDEADVRQA